MCIFFSPSWVVGTIYPHDSLRNPRRHETAPPIPLAFVHLFPRRILQETPGSLEAISFTLRVAVPTVAHIMSALLEHATQPPHCRYKQ